MNRKNGDMEALVRLLYGGPLLGWRHIKNFENQNPAATVDPSQLSNYQLAL
jgi:hypothetical protein